MTNTTDLTNRLLDVANTAAAWGDTAIADMLNESAGAIITLGAELEAARARIAALERKLGYLEAHTIYNDPFKA